MSERPTNTLKQTSIAIRESKRPVFALAREPGGALANPGNEILNAKVNCSRYIVLERAVMQGCFKRSTATNMPKLFEVNVGTDCVLPRGVQ
jgi:hypothetical protein